MIDWPQKRNFNPTPVKGVFLTPKQAKNGCFLANCQFVFYPLQQDYVCCKSPMIFRNITEDQLVHYGVSGEYIFIPKENGYLHSRCNKQLAGVINENTKTLLKDFMKQFSMRPGSNTEKYFYLRFRFNKVILLIK